MVFCGTRSMGVHSCAVQATLSLDSVAHRATFSDRHAHVLLQDPGENVCVCSSCLPCAPVFNSMGVAWLHEVWLLHICRI